MVMLPRGGSFRRYVEEANTARGQNQGLFSPALGGVWDHQHRRDSITMSVRRLAGEQPASFEFTARPSRGQVVDREVPGRPPAVRRYRHPLWLVQKQQGLGLGAFDPRCGRTLGMPVIRVLEIATFYTMFMLEPVGDVALVQVCGTTPCMLRGANELMALCEKKIGPRDHRSRMASSTGRRWNAWACANAPMAAINDYYYGI